eukprot:4326069-Pleurochrysis_carterae.AAC.1
MGSGPCENSTTPLPALTRGLTRLAQLLTTLPRRCNLPTGPLTASTSYDRVRYRTLHQPRTLSRVLCPPSTPFGSAPRVNHLLTVWPGPRVRVSTFIFAARPNASEYTPQGEVAASSAFHAAMPSSSARQQETPSSSTPSSALVEPSTPRVGLILTVWLDGAMLACTYFISNAPAPSETRDTPDSLPPSPPGDEDYVGTFLESWEGALDGLEESEAGAPSTASREFGPSQSSALGSASRGSDSFRGSVMDVPSEFRMLSPPDSRGASSSLFPPLNSPVKQTAEEIVKGLYSEEFTRVKARMTECLQSSFFELGLRRDRASAVSIHSLPFTPGDDVVRVWSLSLEEAIIGALAQNLELPEEDDIIGRDERQVPKVWDESGQPVLLSQRRL